MRFNTECVQLEFYKGGSAQKKLPHSRWWKQFDDCIRFDTNHSVIDRQTDLP